MSLYAVQDNVGNYWDFDNRGFHSPQNNTRRNTTFNLALADALVQMNGSRVVELVEAPAKIVVSEEEAEMLKKAKDTTVWRPAAVISDYAYNTAKDSDQEALLEDRLMRAYVNGYTVAKEKKYNVKVPHTNCGWYFKCEDDENENPPIIDELGCDTAGDSKNWDDSSYFTAAEIEHYGLQDCERVEVTDDEQ